MEQEFDDSNESLQVIMKCKNCRCMTYHTIHGFIGNNRRYRCTNCDIEIWEGESII